ncbi:hypothetical protein [Nostoc sp. DSM 114167]|uniref:hypothetical protein n=1 Tax=Nostoc sp. DSM 114167 TaxID=3439050 RepID=UPI0040459ED5
MSKTRAIAHIKPIISNAIAHWTQLLRVRRRSPSPIGDALASLLPRSGTAALRNHPS